MELLMLVVMIRCYCESQQGIILALEIPETQSSKYQATIWIRSERWTSFLSVSHDDDDQHGEQAVVSGGEQTNISTK